MVLVYLNTGECIEVRDAVEARTVRPYLICRNGQGEEVARFHLRVIQSFTRNERLIRVFRQEICDEGTNRPASSAGRSPA